MSKFKLLRKKQPIDVSKGFSNVMTLNPFLKRKNGESMFKWVRRVKKLCIEAKFTPDMMDLMLGSIMLEANGEEITMNSIVEKLDKVDQFAKTTSPLELKRLTQELREADERGEL